MQHGADDAIARPQIILNIVCSLTSPNLATRKLVADILTFLCYWVKPRGQNFVLQGLRVLQELHSKEDARYDAWFQQFETTIDGRGRMGTMVGASDDVRRGFGGSASAHVEGALNDYAVRASFRLLFQPVLHLLTLAMLYRSRISTSSTLLPRSMSTPTSTFESTFALRWTRLV